MKMKTMIGSKIYSVAVQMITIGLLLLFAGVALAKGPQGVFKTVHNLSTSGEGIFVSNNEEGVCIFCHTPHGGSLTGPLWNRANPVTAYQHYNSATLSPQINVSKTTVNDESLLCLSCHDGSLAMNRVLNESNTTTGGTPNPSTPLIDSGDAYMEDIFFWGGAYPARIGASDVDPNGTSDLRDDHPISFSFYDVYTNASQTRKDGLVDPSVIKANGTVRLFGPDATAGELRVECSTCHDPHVNYDSTLPIGGDPSADESYRPFLYTTNQGSFMCLTCHNK